MKRVLTVLFCIILVAPVSVGNSPPAPLKTFLVDPSLLVKAREAYRSGEAGVQPAVKRLLRDAEKALDFDPVSVTAKGKAPPSGDMHDYMSLSRYWWPDPSKPDGLPYIRRDGETNPEIEKISDHEYLARVIKGVNALAFGYFFSGQERYADGAARILRTWFLDTTTMMNPNLTYAQLIPGRTEIRGTGIIDAHQLPELIDAVGLLEGSPSWTSADQKGLEGWFSTYLQWLLNSEHGRKEAAAKNNHGTWYDVQVCGAALFVGDTAVAASTLRNAKQQRIASQIEPDGSQPAELARTRSLDYSILNLTALFRLASLGDRAGVNLWRYQTPDGRSIRRAVDYLLPFAAGEQKWSRQQITESKPAALAPIFLQSARVWSDNRYRDAALKIEGFNARTDRSLLLLGTW